MCNLNLIMILAVIVILVVLFIFIRITIKYEEHMIRIICTDKDGNLDKELVKTFMQIMHDRYLM